MMSACLFAFFTLAAFCSARLIPADEWAASDSPLTGIALIPQHQCLPTEDRPITSLTHFENAYDDLQGPCRFVMTRTYTAQDVSGFFDVEDAKSNLIVHLQAPAGLQTFVERITFAGVDSSLECDSLEFSRYIPKQTEENTPFLRGLKPSRDAPGTWESLGAHQIIDGDYLLALPSACLIDVTKLSIVTLHVHEPSAHDLRLVASGKLVSLSNDCPLPDVTPISSYEEFSRLQRTLPKVCIYEYGREYKRSLTNAELSEQSDRLTVIAQVGLVEPMLFDQRRQIAAIELGSVLESASDCAKSFVYARKKPSTWRGISDHHPALLLKSSAALNGSIVTPVDGNAGDGTYDFVYVLPGNCRLKSEPTFAFTVFDFNEDGPPPPPPPPSSQEGQEDESALQLTDDDSLLPEEIDPKSISLSSDTKVRPQAGVPAVVCGETPAKIPSNADQEWFDQFVSKLPAGCLYTFSEQVSIAAFANVRRWPRDEPVNDLYNEVAIVRSSEKSLADFGPTKGVSNIQRITLHGSECEKGNIIAYSAATAFTKWDEEASEKWPSTASDIRAKGDISIDLLDKDMPVGGHLIVVSSDCFESGRPISGEITLTSEFVKDGSKILKTLGEPQAAIPFIEKPDSRCSKVTTEETSLDDFAAFLSDDKIQGCPYKLDRHLIGKIDPLNVRLPNAETDSTDVSIALKLDTSNVFSAYVAATLQTVHVQNLPTTCTTATATQFAELDNWNKLPTRIGTPTAVIKEGKLTATGFEDVQKRSDGDHFLNLVFTVKPATCITDKYLAALTYTVTTTAEGTRVPIKTLEPTVARTSIKSNDEKTCKSPTNSPPKDFEAFTVFVHEQDTACTFTFTSSLEVEISEEDELVDRFGMMLSSSEMESKSGPKMDYSVSKIDVSGLACTSGEAKSGVLTKTVSSWNDLWAIETKLKDTKVDSGKASVPLTAGSQVKAGDTVVFVATKECLASTKIKLGYTVEIIAKGENIKIPTLTQLTSDGATPIPTNKDEAVCSKLDLVTDVNGFDTELRTDGSVHCTYDLDLPFKAALVENNKQDDSSSKKSYIGFRIPAATFSPTNEATDVSTKLTKVELSGLDEACSGKTDFVLRTSEEIIGWNDKDKAEVVKDSHPQYSKGVLTFTLSKDVAKDLVCIVESPSGCFKKDKLPGVELSTRSEGKGKTQIAIDNEYDISKDTQGSVTASSSCFLPFKEATWKEMIDFKKTRWNKCAYHLSYPVTGTWNRDNWHDQFSAILPPQVDPKSQDQFTVLSMEVTLPLDEALDITKCANVHVLEPAPNKIVFESWARMREVVDTSTPPDMAQLVMEDWKESTKYLVEVTAKDRKLNLLPKSGVDKTQLWKSWLILQWPDECQTKSPISAISSEIQTDFEGDQTNPRTPGVIKYDDPKGEVISDCYVESPEQNLRDFAESLTSRSKTCKFLLDQTVTAEKTVDTFNYERPRLYINMPAADKENAVSLALKSVTFLDMLTSGPCKITQVQSFDANQNMDQLGKGAVVDGFTQKTPEGSTGMVLEYTGKDSLFAKYLIFYLQGQCKPAETTALKLHLTATAQGKADHRTPIATTFTPTAAHVSTAGAYCSDFVDNGKVRNLAQFRTFLDTKPKLCLFNFVQPFSGKDLQGKTNEWHMPNDQKVEESELVLLVNSRPTAKRLLSARKRGDVSTPLTTIDVTFDKQICDGLKAQYFRGDAAALDLDHFKAQPIPYQATIDAKTVTLVSDATNTVPEPYWLHIETECALAVKSAALSYTSQGRGTVESLNPVTPLHLLKAVQPKTDASNCAVAEYIGSNDFAYFLTKAKRGCRYKVVQEFGGDLTRDNLFINKERKVGIAFELPVKQLRSHDGLYTAELRDVLIEVAKDKCDPDGVVVQSIISRPSPLNDNLYVGATDITKSFDIQLTDSKALKLTPKTAENLDLARPFIVVTLDNQCDPGKDAVPITFSVYSEGEGVAFDISGSSAQVTLLSLSFALLLALTI